MTVFVGIISDPETGKVLESFEYKTQGNLQFTVLSEDQVSVDQMREAFESASKKASVGRAHIAQSIGKGMYNALKAPWKLTKAYVLSLEKVRKVEC